MRNSSNFIEAPRWLGYPSQVYVYRDDAIQRLISFFNGKKPCYASTYKFPKRESMIVDKIAFDIDHPKDINIPYKATKNIKQICENLNLPYLINFSGMHGFHFYIFFEKLKEINKNKLLALQIAFMEKANMTFRTKDGRATNTDSKNELPVITSNTLGRIRQLMRIPTTKYVSETHGVNGHYCRYVKPHEFDKGMGYILHKAKQPGEMPVQPKTDLTFDSLWDLLDTKEIRRTTYEAIELQNNINVVPPVSCIIANCLKREIQLPHPSHLARRETTVWLKFLGFSDGAITRFYRTLGWKDWDVEITTYQIKGLYPRLPSCLDLSRSVAVEHECDNCPLNGERNGNGYN